MGVWVGGREGRPCHAHVRRRSRHLPSSRPHHLARPLPPCPRAKGAPHVPLLGPLLPVSVHVSVKTGTAQACVFVRVCVGGLGAAPARPATLSLSPTPPLPPPLSNALPPSAPRTPASGRRKIQEKAKENIEKAKESIEKAREKHREGQRKHREGQRKHRECQRKHREDQRKTQRRPEKT